ncbi:MAG: hypothetical protein WDN45_05555 [Caulobacteraceae bacterium]
MTATALITVAHKGNVLLVPNAALRFNPKATPANQQRGIVIGARQNNAGSQTAEFGRGAPPPDLGGERPPRASSRP